ncbi:hypothetical protein IKE86_02175 [Candidatus Saccharibacteria bacterium]|nr:hypothetical protein [Candidatus Saccharibacteria bacterium]
MNERHKMCLHQLPSFIQKNPARDFFFIVKLVIVYPLWLLLILLAIFLIIFKILWGKKKEKK